MLGTHQEIANWSEANIIWDPFGHPWGGTNSRSELPNWVDPIAYHARWWQDNQGRGQDIRAIFGAFQTLRRKKYFLNKTPYLVFRIPQILEIFPDARFIHIVRDGRAVVSSRLTRDLGFGKRKQTHHRVGELKFTFEQAALRSAAFWKENVQEVAKQDIAYRLTAKGLLLDLSYEGLCDDPTGTLRQICDFMGVDLARLGASAEIEQITDQNYKWRENLTPELVRQVVAEMEPVFSERGYTNS